MPQQPSSPPVTGKNVGSLTLRKKTAIVSTAGGTGKGTEGRRTLRWRSPPPPRACLLLLPAPSPRPVCSSGHRPLSPTARVPCCTGPRPLPGALVSGFTQPPPGAASAAHTSSGQEPASPWQRLPQRRAKSGLPVKAHISEKGQKPCLQALLRQHTGVRPAGHAQGDNSTPGPGQTVPLPPVTATGGSPRGTP